MLCSVEIGYLDGLLKQWLNSRGGDKMKKGILYINQFFGQIGGAAAGAIIGAYLSTVIGDNIKNGVWVDYNYFAGRVNNFGWQ